jgi:hypothetical protein
VDRPVPFPALLIVRDPVGDVATLRACLAAVVAGTGAHEVRCDIRLLGAPGLAAAGVFAGLRLTARELGCAFHVVGAPRRFERLLVLVGLDDVVPCSSSRDPLAPDPGSSR